MLNFEARKILLLVSSKSQISFFKILVQYVGFWFEQNESLIVFTAKGKPLHFLTICLPIASGSGNS